MTGGLTTRQRAIKRAFDLVVASIGLLVSWPVIVVAALVARAETGESGIFRQTRIGRHGEPFEVLKIRTMRTDATITTTVTVDGDPRITRRGRVFRNTKIDELPQLLNVLRGDMSIVGPRPDVPGFHDRLEGDDRVVLTLRPGITGPAALAFRDEGALLNEAEDSEIFNRMEVFPAKVAIDRRYVEQYQLRADAVCIAATARALLSRTQRRLSWVDYVRA